MWLQLSGTQLLDGTLGAVKTAHVVIWTAGVVPAPAQEGCRSAPSIGQLHRIPENAVLHSCAVPFVCGETLCLSTMSTMHVRQTRTLQTCSDG